MDQLVQRHQQRFIAQQQAGFGGGKDSVNEVAGLELLLGRGQRLHPVRDLLEALLPGRPGELGVGPLPLHPLPGRRRGQVLLRRAHRPAGGRVADVGQEVEVADRVARLTLGHRSEQGSGLRKAFDVGLLGEVQESAAGLALEGEGRPQVGLGP